MNTFIYRSNAGAIRGAVMDTFWNMFFRHFPSSIQFWVAGGAVRDLLSGQRIRDIDVFFPNERNRLAFEATLKSLCGDRLRLQHDNATATHYETLHGSIFGRVQIDSIKRYFETPGATIEQFDFTINCVAVNQMAGGEMLMTMHHTFNEDQIAKRLIVNRLPFPADSLRRAFKYVARGYKICPVELQKVVDAIRGAPTAVVLPNGAVTPNGFYMVD